MGPDLWCLDHRICPLPHSASAFTGDFGKIPRVDRRPEIGPLFDALVQFLRCRRRGNLVSGSPAILDWDHPHGHPVCAAARLPKSHATRELDLRGLPGFGLYRLRHFDQSFWFDQRHGGALLVRCGHVCSTQRSCGPNPTGKTGISLDISRLDRMDRPFGMIDFDTPSNLDLPSHQRNQSVNQN